MKMVGSPEKARGLFEDRRDSDDGR
jgi:hypothetical protein